AVDLYEVRASLESLVVQRFVERATDDEVTRLNDTVEDLAVLASETDDIRAILAAKDRLYAVLIAGAGSSALQQLLEGVQARGQVLRATSLPEAGRTPEVVRELRAVVEAITARDAERASRLCAEHVRAAAATALSSLRQAEAESA